MQPCPKISGYVLTPEAFGIAGVVLNGLPGNPSTDNTGFYSVQVEPSWSGMVTPQKEDYTFEPVECSYENLTVDQTMQNYTGVLPQYTLTVEISGEGRVEGDGGIDCPDVCSQTFDKNTIVTFSALPADGFIFDNCPEAQCNDTGDCSLKIMDDSTITVAFIPDPTITPTPTEAPKPTPTPSGTSTPDPVPEPGTMILLGLGLIGLLGLRARAKKK